jgi:hypothetical protein
MAKNGCKIDTKHPTFCRFRSQKNNPFLGLDTPVYLVSVTGNSKANVMVCLDREGKTRRIEIDPTEALFKLALAVCS